MKYCKSCGAENNDENQFCFNCRCDGFNPNPLPPPAPIPPAMSAPPPMPPQGMGSMPGYNAPVVVKKEKKPLGIFDMLGILGFVAAIVGMFTTSIILHPLAAISSLVAFVGNTRFKGLAIAGFVTAIVGGIVYTVISLYQNNLIPEWITNGAFH